MKTKSIINKIANYFGFSFVKSDEYATLLLKNTKLLQLPPFNNKRDLFIKSLESKNYKSLGSFSTENSFYQSFGNQTNTILIQINKDKGDIMKVYRHINENNFDVLQAKILDENLSLTQAKKHILEIVKYSQEIQISQENLAINPEKVIFNLNKAIVLLRDIEN